jgi:hypothetical protein
MSQLRITTEEIGKFEAALASADAQGRDLHPLLRRALVAGLASQLEELRAEQSALIVGALVAIGVADNDRADRPRAPLPPLGAAGRAAPREEAP